METDLSVSGGTLYVCTSVPYSMTDTPGAVTTLSADTGVLSLGTLIQGNSYANGLGSLEELPIPQRAPLTVTTDLEFAANSATVTDPTSALVNQALEELIVAAGDAGFVAGSDVDYDQATCHSLDQGLLALNLSATFVDDGPRSQLEYEQNSNQNTVIAAFRQVMFMTSIVQPESPAGFFGDGFTEALLNEHLDEGRISSTNLPVYVADITWGRLLVMTVTSTYSDSEIRSAISASFTAILGGEVEAEYLELLTSPETSVGIATVGGETEQALAAVRTGSLGTYFASDAALTTAAPISYTLRSLADNSVASVGETVDYARTDCSADIVSYYDDFEIGIADVEPSYAVRAVGIMVGGNIAEIGESLRVYARHNVLVREILEGLPDCDCWQFVGVISAVPITRIQFNEHAGSNDICIKDPCFGLADE